MRVVALLLLSARRGALALKLSYLGLCRARPWMYDNVSHVVPCYRAYWQAANLLQLGRGHALLGDWDAAVAAFEQVRLLLIRRRFCTALFCFLAVWVDGGKMEKSGKGERNR